MRRFALILLATFLTACPGDRVEKPVATADRQVTEPTAPAVEPPALSGPRNGLRVDFPTASGGTATGYLSHPTTAGRHPAIIVIQEWWGVNDWIKEQTDRLAGLGYVALAVDLYRGKIAADADVAHQLMRGLPEDQALADLKAAIDYLAARPDVDATRVGAVGWCMGGGYAVKLATVEPRVSAVVVNYGSLVTDPAAIARIKAAILGNFGGTDEGIPSSAVRAFESAATAAGKRVDLKIYEGQGHAFMNPNNKGGYDAAAAADAWSRSTSFFEQILRR